MPRVAREQSSSNIYHIMLRGNERKFIFYDDYDKLRFIDILRKMKENGEYILYAYCLMDNHVHLLIEDKNEDIEVNLSMEMLIYLLLQDIFTITRLKPD